MNPSPPSSTAIYRLSRRNFIQYGSICIGSSFIAGCTNSNQPSTSNSQLDKVTFGTNWIAQGIPKITVAAIFQKDPQCFIVHPNTATKTLADLKGRPIYVSASTNITYWPLLKAKYGFTDDQKRPYNCYGDKSRKDCS
ncbi:hypothetical protein FM036_29505 [Nostoc sp. HG1]|nr:hypothetical protein [Nostoc sp. HG1]